ncbi:MAG: glutathione S-transferase N-terminal domain-containing protein [Candidatus Binatia bacterium]
MTNVPYMLDVTTSLLATALRLGFGSEVGRLGPRPRAALELYEFEACPFCRKVREAMSILDLDAIVYPCPRGAARHRDSVKRLGGKLQFPFLVDPNDGASMYESDDIVAHLFRAYGDGPPPLTLRLGILGDLSSSLASFARPTQGRRYLPSRPPARLLELWSYEASPFCRIVRETLTALALPYLLHNVARGSRKREAFVARSGKMMVPYLADPNTNTDMFESAAIVGYLRDTYGQSARP